MWTKAQEDGDGFQSMKQNADLVFDGIRNSGLGGATASDTLKTISDTDTKGKRTDPAGEAKEEAYKKLYDRVEARRQAYHAIHKKNPDDAQVKVYVAEEAAKMKRLTTQFVSLRKNKQFGLFGGPYEEADQVALADLKVGDKIPFEQIPPIELGRMLELFSGRLGGAKYTTDRVERLWAIEIMGKNGVIPREQADSAIEAILDERD